MILAININASFGPVLILGSITAIVLAAIMISTRNTAIRVIGPIAIVMALLAAIFWVRSSRQVIEHPSVAEPEFEPTADMLADAGPQPSREHAVRALVRRVYLFTPVRHVSEPNVPRRIEVIAPASDPIADGIAGELRDLYRRAKVERLASPGPEEAGDSLRITLTTSEEGTTRPGNLKFKMSLQLNGDVRTHELALVNKPWAADPTRHLAEARNRVVIAHSPRPGSSAADALNQAYEQAAAQIWSPIRGRVEAQVGNLNEDDAQRLRARLNESIRLGRIPGTDQFVQEIGRDYGWIWRASVMVPTDDASLRPIVMDLAGGIERQRRSSLAGMGAIVGLLLVILLLYFFLNTATRGYFQFSLRAAALLVLTAGVLVIMMLA